MTRRELMECDLCHMTEAEQGSDPAEWASGANFDVCPRCQRTIFRSRVAQAYEVQSAVSNGQLYVRSAGISLGVDGGVLEQDRWHRVSGITLVPELPEPERKPRRSK